MTDGQDDGQTAATSADAGLFPPGVGERLRAAREALKMDLTDVATRTRVPLRHLEAIERSNYASLPSPTYAIGFARAYARVVGVDEGEVVRELRTAVGREPVPSVARAVFEPLEPMRVPSRLLAWTALAVAILLAVAYGVWRSELSGPDAPVVVEAPAEPTPVAAPSEPVTPPSAGAQVVLTATQPVWIKIYDRNRTRLVEREFAVGESFTVPNDAIEPMILTGRPDVLTVTIDGREVAPLGTGRIAIKDVAISAAALAGRGQAGAGPVDPSAVPVAAPPPLRQ